LRGRCNENSLGFSVPLKADRLLSSRISVVNNQNDDDGNLIQANTNTYPALGPASEPTQIEFRIGVFPGRIELAADEVGGFRFALGAESLFKRKEAPTVTWPTLQIFAKDLF